MRDARIARTVMDRLVVLGQTGTMDALERTSQATRASYEDRLMRVLVYIAQHLDEDLEVETLARVACFSSYHFHRVFAAGIGEPLSAYVKRVRLERAAALLVHGVAPIGEVARRSGFESVEGFGRAFKRAFGVGPGQFRMSLDRAWVDDPRTRSEDELRERISARLRRPVARAVDVEVGRFEGARVVGVRHLGPYHRVGIAWGRVMVWAAMRGHLTRGARLFGIAHDDPAAVPARELRYDACVEIEGDVRVGRGVSLIEIPALEVAVARHEGPYDSIPQTYEYLFGNWLGGSGREPGDFPSFCEHPRVRGGRRSGDGVRAWIHLPLKELL